MDVRDHNSAYSDCQTSYEHVERDREIKLNNHRTNPVQLLRFLLLRALYKPKTTWIEWSRTGQTKSDTASYEHAIRRDLKRNSMYILHIPHRSGAGQKGSSLIIGKYSVIGGKSAASSFFKSRLHVQVFLYITHSKPQQSEIISWRF